MLRELDGSGEHFVRGTVLLAAFVGLEELHEAVAEILDLKKQRNLYTSCNLKFDRSTHYFTYRTFIPRDACSYGSV